VQFPTPTFAAFFTVVLLGSWLLAGRRLAWRVWVLLAGGVFYGYASPRMLALLGLSAVGNWALARGIGHGGRHAHRLLLLGVAGNLAVLATYKYYDFFASSVTDALAGLGLTLRPPLLQVVLPVGLSFVTFAAIAYLVEVRRQVTPVAPLLDVAVWLSFFPTVTAGPITRPSEFLPQLPGRGDRRRVELGEATWLIARGLAKKVVLASWLASTITDDVFTSPAVHPGPVLLLGVYAYAAQLYLDFSGYTDLARGCALLLGIRLPENFDAPYAARSIHDFWNRWHLTLSRWLRDFLFTPLERRFRAHWWQAFGVPVVVMALAGLWHGAAWTFVAFGLVHGVSLACERWLHERRRAHRRRRRDTVLARAGARVVAFHVVCLGWVFFASESLSQAGVLLRRLGTGWDAVPEVSGLLVPLLLAVLAVQLLPVRVTGRIRTGYVSAAPALQVAGLAAGLTVVDALGPTGVAPFIYYRF
jgi:D-alanyl-lipoteichoic acid acyltransferase DltB (MBOAT superfamily)